MKFDKDLSAIHAYLCADGYLTDPTKWKNYVIGFRNTNPTLLEDYQKRFYRYFKIKPKINKSERCSKNSKDIHQKLVGKFSSFKSRKWKMPKLNKKLSKAWLRAFFDCKGWVFCKSHQNRHIGLESANRRGLSQVKNSLQNLGINCLMEKRTNREIHRVLIYGKGNLNRFKEKIGFLHPDKKKKLEQTVKDYVDYEWKFPEEEVELKEFLKKKLREKIRIKKSYQVRVFSKEKSNLNKLRTHLRKFFDIESSLRKSANGQGNTYYVLGVWKNQEVKKLINIGVMENIFKE